MVFVSIRRVGWQRHLRPRHSRAEAAILVPIEIDGRRHLVPQHLVRAYQRGLLAADER
ncbi:50S ribosomal protein L32 [Kitasatospora sp. NPDC001095]